MNHKYILIMTEYYFLTSNLQLPTIKKTSL